VARAKKKKLQPFNVKTFLSTVNGGRTVKSYRKNEKIFSQGDPADAVFYIQEGQVKVCVISEAGKEAVVALHGNEDFFGEGCLSGQPLRLATVAAMTECVIMRLDKVAILRVLRDQPKFSEAFMAFLLEPVIAKISQETLAEIIGTTRSRVSTFMNKFRELGFINYNGVLEVHNSLLNVVLHDNPHLRRDETGK